MHPSAAKLFLALSFALIQDREFVELDLQLTECGVEKMEERIIAIESPDAESGRIASASPVINSSPSWIVSCCGNCKKANNTDESAESPGEVGPTNLSSANQPEHSAAARISDDQVLMYPVDEACTLKASVDPVQSSSSTSANKADRRLSPVRVHPQREDCQSND